MLLATLLVGNSKETPKFVVAYLCISTSCFVQSPSPHPFPPCIFRSIVKLLAPVTIRRCMLGTSRSFETVERVINRVFETTRVPAFLRSISPVHFFLFFFLSLFQVTGSNSRKKRALRTFESVNYGRAEIAFEVDSPTEGEEKERKGKAEKREKREYSIRSTRKKKRGWRRKSALLPPEEERERASFVREERVNILTSLRAVPALESKTNFSPGTRRSFGPRLDAPNAASAEE